MASYTGGTTVGGGYYWNPRKWEIEVVPEEGGMLRATSDARYLKIPFPVLFLVVPLLGLVFIVSLPLIGFALFASAIGKAVAHGVKRAATELAATVVPGGFATGEAHFTGKPGEEVKPAEVPREPRIEKLEEEIEARKNEKR